VIWQELDTQRRVVGALLMREIHTRFGRQGLGFALTLGESLIFAIPVLLIWSIVRAKYENNLPLIQLLWSGYLPLLLFRHMGSTALGFIRSNSTLLYHRRVTLLDVFVARAILEVSANIIAVLVTFLLFYILGEIDIPRDFPMFLMGYLYMIWWCVAVGLTIGALCERSILVEKIWQPISYLYMFFSGFWYLAEWLPPRLRDIALYQPSFQAYEMIRGGLFGNVIKTYGDPVYTTFVLTLLTFISLWALREGRKYVMID
jgi:capsular polysaccharide transport system permease protein